MSEIRLALIGAGAFGRKHLDVMSKKPGFGLAGIADPFDAGRALAERLGVPWNAEPEALLEAVRPDGAIVATPNALHVPHGLACLRHGVPALVEKPIAETPEGSLELAAAESTGVPLLVGHHRRHNPILEAARAALAEGRIGRPVAIHLNWLIRKPDSYFEVPWRGQPGGGPVIINLVHELDALRFVVGEIVAVQAMTAKAVRGLAVEDTAAITLRFESGALGTVIVSDTVEAPWSWEMTSGENSAYPLQAAHNGLIAGTAGSLSLPDLELWRHVERAGAERGWNTALQRERIPFVPDDAYQRQLHHFGRVVRRKEAPRVTARDATRSLAVCLAIHGAARTGREVMLGTDAGTAP